MVLLCFPFALSWYQMHVSALYIFTSTNSNNLQVIIFLHWHYAALQIVLIFYFVFKYFLLPCRVVWIFVFMRYLVVQLQISIDYLTIFFFFRIFRSTLLGSVYGPDACMWACVCWGFFFIFISFFLWCVKHCCARMCT